MGHVVEFPEGRRLVRSLDAAGTQKQSAHIIILPVVRIERHPDEPSDGVEGAAASGRRRRRRATRT
ncbi:MAG TPA: hypothetical protein VNK48_15490 [Xanthobacteraceae bacterium]|nr:hypothetical protein [Xanthobacteraceae bacterium]